jgi:glycosyltransferase involved in cell wall biosynthesis
MAIRETKGDNVMVSVCMITYNHEPFISQAIEGVLMQQSNFFFELVIGEDCSTDSTWEICEGYAQKHPEIIRLLPSERNLGMMPNFVRTLDICTGKYIALCEGDDYWIDPYKLQKQVDFLEENPDYGLVHSECNFYYQKNSKLIRSWNKKSKSDIPNGYIFEQLLVDNFIKTLTVCFRRELIQNTEFWVLIKGNNWLQGDYPMWLEFSRHTKFYYMPESLATRRVLSESASNFKLPLNKLKFNLSAYDINSYFIEKYGCTDYVKNEIYINRNKILIRYAFFMNDKEVATLAFNDLKSKTSYRNIGFKVLIYYIVLQNKILRKIVSIILPGFKTTG